MDSDIGRSVDFFSIQRNNLNLLLFSLVLVALCVLFVGFPLFFQKMKPLQLSETLDKFDILVNVQGGGPTGQAGAVRHGISRALVEFNPEFRPALKKAGFLRRDPRMKERKKPGQPGARKRFQFSKR